MPSQIRIDLFGLSKVREAQLHCVFFEVNKSIYSCAKAIKCAMLSKNGGFEAAATRMIRVEIALKSTFEYRSSFWIAPGEV